MARAIASLSATFGSLRVAPLYRTDPISAIPQDRYLNTAVAGLTTKTPAEVLREAWRLETEAGRPSGARRRRSPADAPRTLDIDLLLYGDLMSADPELTVPHPRLHERRFVLVPLAAIVPDAPVPPAGTSVAELLQSLEIEETRDGATAPWVERIEWPAEARALLPESAG